MSTPATLNRSLELAKWVAIITMVIDHVGLIFFPSRPEFRLIGRLAFPLFCWIIAVRLTEKPERAPAYLYRLLIWTVISQAPFWVCFHYKDGFFHTINIMATLGLGVAITALLDKMKTYHLIKQALSWIAIVALLTAGGYCDYGTLGVLVIPLTVLAAQRSLTLSATAVGLAAGFANFYLTIPWLPQQPSYALALTICGFLGGTVAKACLMTDLPLPRLPRWFFYAFYPGHLVLIILYVSIFMTPAD